MLGACEQLLIQRFYLFAASWDFLGLSWHFLDSRLENLGRSYEYLGAS